MINKNVLALAYLGDAIYEVYIREYLISKGTEKVEKLQHMATNYVSAKGQGAILRLLMANEFFSEEELAVIYRARNHKSNHHPKNTDIITYKYATGLEAVIGYLYLNGQQNRIDELMKEVIGD